MPDFTVGGFGVGSGGALFPNGIRFERVPMLGNAGAKIDRLIDTVLSANVDDPAVPKPLEKKVVEILGFTPTIELKAALDFALGTGQPLNPASAELPFGFLPDGTAVVGGGAGGGGPPAPPDGTQPMHRADP